MSDPSNLPALTQQLGLSPENWRAWLTHSISLDEQTVAHALRLCPDWNSFIRLRDIKPFIKSLTEGKVPVFVPTPKSKRAGNADEREASKSKSKKLRRAAAVAAATVATDGQVVHTSIVLPALAVENLTAAHRFVRLVCINTCRTALRGCDLSPDMLDEFKEEAENLEKMLANPEQIPRLTSGSDTVDWLGRVRRWAARVSGGTGIPLAYLLRPQAVPGPLPALKDGKPFVERSNSHAEGIVADLIEYTSHSTKKATQDSRFLFQKFDYALSGTSYQTTLLKHAKTQNGVAVFKEIESSVDHAPQWEQRHTDHQSRLDTLVPNEKESLTVYFSAIEKSREEVKLCATNGYGEAPTDKAIVSRALKCIKEVFPKDLDLHAAVTRIKSDPTLKKNYERAKNILLSSDPNPPPTKAVAGQKRGPGRISAVQQDSSKPSPDPVKGRTGVILHVDYSSGQAYKHLSPEQYKELMDRNAPGNLRSWRKNDLARALINKAKKASESQQDTDAKVSAQVSAAVAKRTKALTKERNKLAAGVVSMSSELKSAHKQRRRDVKKTAKKKSSRRQKQVGFADVGAAKGILKKRRRHEVESDSDSSESDHDSSSDDSSMSSADESSSRNGKSAAGDFQALISSARKIERERTEQNQQKTQRSRRNNSNMKRRKDRKKRSR